MSASRPARIGRISRMMLSWAEYWASSGPRRSSSTVSSSRRGTERSFRGSLTRLLSLSAPYDTLLAVVLISFIDQIIKSNKYMRMSIENKQSYMLGILTGIGVIIILGGVFMLGRSFGGDGTKSAGTTAGT